MIALALLVAVAVQEDVEALIRQLGDDPVEVRERARGKLTALGERVIPALEKAVADGDPEIRAQAKEILRKLIDHRDRRRRAVELVRRRWLARDFASVEHMVRTAFGAEAVESVRYVPARKDLSEDIVARLGRDEGVALVGTDVYVSLPRTDAGWESALAAPQGKVTLKVSNFRGALEQIQAAAQGRKLVLDDTNVPRPVDVDAFEVRDVPWTEALDALLEHCRFAIQEQTAESIGFHRPPRVAFAIKNADIKVIVDLLRRVSRAEIEIPSELRGATDVAARDVAWYDALQEAVAALGDYEVVRLGSEKCRILSLKETAARRTLHRECWSAYVVVRFK